MFMALINIFDIGYNLFINYDIFKVNHYKIFMIFKDGDNYIWGIRIRKLPSGFTKIYLYRLRVKFLHTAPRP